MNSTTFLAFLLPIAAMRCAPPCCASSATDLPLGLYVVSAASAGAASAPSVATEARAAIAPVRALCLLMFLLSSMQFRLCRPVSSIRCDRGGFPIRFPDFGVPFSAIPSSYAEPFRNCICLDLSIPLLTLCAASQRTPHYRRTADEHSSPYDDRNISTA